MKIKPIKIVLFFLIGVIILATGGLIYMLFNSYSLWEILTSAIIILVFIGILSYILNNLRR